MCPKKSRVRVQPQHPVYSSCTFNSLAVSCFATFRPLQLPSHEPTPRASRMLSLAVAFPPGLYLLASLRVVGSGDAQCGIWQWGSQWGRTVWKLAVGLAVGAYSVT